MSSKDDGDAISATTTSTTTSPDCIALGNSTLLLVIDVDASVDASVDSIPVDLLLLAAQDGISVRYGGRCLQ